MSLTRWLGALALALLLASPAARADVGAFVVWTDARLYDGRLIKAEALKGRTVVVEYWATWCPYCMKQNPHVQRLHERHGGKDLVVLTISLDRTPEAIRAYKARKGYSFSTMMESELTRSWFPKRKGLPVVYVVDPSGLIVFHEAGEMFEEDILGLVRYARK